LIFWAKLEKPTTSPFFASEASKKAIYIGKTYMMELFFKRYLNADDYKGCKVG
jgi:hypothetical protein